MLAPVLLLVTLVGLSAFMDPQGALGTDTGGKVATLRVMAADDTWSPDVGYWAADEDGDADLHPLFFTEVIDGRFVNVTTLPMILAARPLWELGGYRLSLLLPMAGTVLAAVAARHIARRAGHPDGWPAFWLVGLTSPLTIYALDLWEHSLGVALVLTGVVALAGALDEASWRSLLGRGLVAGAAFGAAASMRTESLVYAFVACAVFGALLLSRSRRLALVAGLGVAVSAGFGILVLANTALEEAALGGGFRASRAAGAASSGTSEGVLRLQEAAITALGSGGASAATALALGVPLVACVVVVARRGAADRALLLAGGVLVALYLARWVRGPGFVPGMLVATPLAIVGVLAWRRTPARPFVAVALGALPLVWAFQYTGGAAPQWGGRYLLVSAVLLLAVGTVELDRLAPARRVLLVGLSVAVTALGLVWMSQRTSTVADSAETVLAVEGPVVSVEPFWLRELGAFYEPDRPWLSVRGVPELPEAQRLLAARGEPEFWLLELVDGTGGAELATEPLEVRTRPLFEGVVLRLRRFPVSVEVLDDVERAFGPTG